MYHYFVFALVGAATADLLYDGKCPSVTPLEHFDLKAYEGIWYEVAMLPLYHQMNGKCSTSEYIVHGDVATVKNSQIVNGVKQYLDGTVTYADTAEKSGKIVLTFQIGDRVRAVEPYILATDYNNYAIAYSCRYDEAKKSHYTFAWVLSRSKTLEGDAKTSVETFLQNHADIIDSTKLIRTDFSEEGCTYTRSVSIADLRKH